MSRRRWIVAVGTTLVGAITIALAIRICRPSVVRVPPETQDALLAIDASDAVRVTSLGGTTRSASDYARFDTIPKSDSNFSLVVAEIRHSVAKGQIDEAHGPPLWILTFTRAGGSTAVRVTVQYDAIEIGGMCYPYDRHMYLERYVSPEPRSTK